MSDELKPCPFCKSGWLYETQRNGYCDDTAAMFCNSCKAIVTWEQVEEEGVNEKTRQFVRERWNTRADEKHELAANDNLPAETDISADGHACNDAMVDSREQLEADAMFDAKMLWNSADECIVAIRGWLDRQAAITKRKCQYEIDAVAYDRDYFRKHVQQMNGFIDELTAEREQYREDMLAQTRRVAELTAERDELKDLQKQVMSERNHAIAERDELRAECEGLEHANKRQARKIHDVCEANSKLKAKLEKEEQLNSGGWNEHAYEMGGR